MPIASRRGDFFLLAGAVLLAAALATSGTSAPAAASDVGDAERGAEIFKKCRMCHLIGPGARHTVGPDLTGVVDRKAGAAQGYPFYSESLRQAAAKGLVWDAATLHRYLERPSSVVPNGRMSFDGLKTAAERDDLIAYLRRFTK